MISRTDRIESVSQVICIELTPEAIIAASVCWRRRLPLECASQTCASRSDAITFLRSVSGWPDRHKIPTRSSISGSNSKPSDASARLCGPRTRSTCPRSNIVRSSWTNPVCISTTQFGFSRINLAKARLRNRPATIGGAAILNSPTAPWADWSARMLACSSACRMA